MTKIFVRTLGLAALATVLFSNTAHAVLLTSFEEPAEGATSYTSVGGEIGWTRTSTGTAPHAQEGVRARANITGGPFVPAINNTPPDGSKVFLSRAGATGGLGDTLTFDTVGVSPGTEVVVKYFASATSWEAGDFLRITGTLSNASVVTLLNIAGGTTPNQIDAVEGVWRDAIYLVTPGISSIQLKVETSSNSSVGDEGFAIDQIETRVPPPPDNDPSIFELTASTDFESDAVGARKRLAAGFPNANPGEPLAFRGSYTGNSGVTDYPSNGGHQIQVNNGRIGNGDESGVAVFAFDPVAMGGAASGLVEVSADIRTEGRASGFEGDGVTGDEFHIYIEGSNDGVTWFLVDSLFDAVGNGTDPADPLDLLDSDGAAEEDAATGEWFHIANIIDVSSIDLLRVVVDADTDSNNEFIMIDNVRIAEVPEPAGFVLAGLGLLGIVVGLRGRRNA